MKENISNLVLLKWLYKMKKNINIIKMREWKDSVWFKIIDKTVRADIMYANMIFWVRW